MQDDVKCTWVFAGTDNRLLTL